MPHWDQTAARNVAQSSWVPQSVTANSREILTSPLPISHLDRGHHFFQTKVNIWWTSLCVLLTWPEVGFVVLCGPSVVVFDSSSKCWKSIVSGGTGELLSCSSGSNKDTCTLKYSNLARIPKQSVELFIVFLWMNNKLDVKWKVCPRKCLSLLLAIFICRICYRGLKNLLGGIEFLQKADSLQNRPCSGAQHGMWLLGQKA